MSVWQDEEELLFKTADGNFTKRKIEEDEDIKKNENFKASFAVMVAKKLATSWAEDTIEILNAIISIIMTMFYALDTYFDNNTPEPIKIIELILLVYLFMDYLLFFIISESRLLYLFSLQSFVNAITIIPLFLLRTHLISDEKNKVILFSRVLRIFSVQRLDKFFSKRNMSLARAYFKLLYMIFVTIIIFAAGMLEVENAYINSKLTDIEEKDGKGIPLTQEEEDIPTEPY